MFIGILAACFALPLLSEMTLEEKVGQLLMVHFNGEEANEEAKFLVQNLRVGGIIYYNWANGLNTPKQVWSLSTGLQELNAENHNRIPLLIATDQEGGVVSRLTDGFTVFPGNKALGETKDPTLAKLSAEAIGQELRAVGVNFNLSPVVDVNSNPRNPVIGIRAFSDSQNMVASFAKSALEGYRKEGIVTALKHFPGHGDVEIDSHQDLPVTNKSAQELWATEFFPFLELAKEADATMTAHIIVPSIDPANCATLSKNVLDVLREEIGFKGVVISDSLVMEGLLKSCPSIDAAAIQALNAGCDILLLGGKQLVGAHADLELTVNDIERIHQSLVRAVQTGIVSEKRLNEAVQRVLDLKGKYDLEPPSNPPSSINTPEHRLLAKNIASLALKISKTSPFPVLKNCSIAVFAPDIMRKTIEQTSLLNLGKKTTALFFSGLAPNEQQIKAAEKLANKSDALIFCSYNAWNNSPQTALFEVLLKSRKPLGVIVLRDPLDVSFFSKADVILNTFSPTPPSIQAACDKLEEICEGYP